MDLISKSLTELFKVESLARSLTQKDLSISHLAIKKYTILIKRKNCIKKSYSCKLRGMNKIASKLSNQLREIYKE